MRKLVSASIIMGLALSGCVSTVGSIVTAPVKIAGKAVDMATTSQSESDEKRGRNLRKREEQYGKLERDYRRHTRQCEQGDDDACDEARADYAAMQDLRASIPAER
jgi:hypothetical protein